MRTDHRPYWMRRLDDGWQLWWQRHFLEPQFDAVGVGLNTTLPWRIDVIGPNVTIGKYVHLRPSRFNPILFTTWPNGETRGEIDVGDFVLITPGARILAARRITLGKGVMLGSNVTLSDSDWHDIYDRGSAPGDGAPITLGDNVWIGERSIVCKGVSIGENSIIGAGSVVTRDIPANVIAAGCPAKVVKELDPSREMVTRAKLFENPAKLEQETWDLYKYLMRDNRLLKWLRVKLAPTIKD